MYLNKEKQVEYYWKLLKRNIEMYLNIPPKRLDNATINVEKKHRDVFKFQVEILKRTAKNG